MELVFEMESRITKEHQASVVTEINGFLLGTEHLSSSSPEEIASVLTLAIKQLPRCTKLVLEVGKPVQFSRIESITQKEPPSGGNYHIDQILHTAGLFGTFFLKGPR